MTWREAPVVVAPSLAAPAIGLAVPVSSTESTVAASAGITRTPVVAVVATGIPVLGSKRTLLLRCEGRLVTARWRLWGVLRRGVGRGAWGRFCAHSTAGRGCTTFQTLATETHPEWFLARTLEFPGRTGIWIRILALEAFLFTGAGAHRTRFNVPGFESRRWLGRKR
jgi:hypothetical protein